MYLTNIKADVRQKRGGHKKDEEFRIGYLLNVYDTKGEIGCMMITFVWAEGKLVLDH